MKSRRLMRMRGPFRKRRLVSCSPIDEVASTAPPLPLNSDVRPAGSTNAPWTGELLRREPRLAAHEDEFSSRVGLRQVNFDACPVFGWQTADDFRNAAVLTGSGQFKRPLNCRCRGHHGSV